MGFALSHPKTPSTPATKGLTIFENRRKAVDKIR